MTKNSKIAHKNNQLEQKEAELSLLSSVQQALASRLDMQGIFDLIGEHVRKTFDAQAVVIRSFNIEAGVEYWHYAIEKGEMQIVLPRPLDDFARFLHALQEPLVVNDHFDEFIRKFSDETSVEGETPKSAVFVPLVAGSFLVGNISIQDVDREGVYNDDDVRLLSTLANSMSVALENARLFNETEQRLAELQTVNSISRAMISHLDLDALIQLVGEQMKETFKADIVYIALYDRVKDMIYFPFEFGDKNEPRRFGDGFTERIITSNKPLLINKDLAETREQLKAKQIGRITSSFLGVPIQTGDVPNGVISVQSTEEENRFDENDLRLLSTIAANVSVFMQNAEAYKKLRVALDELKAAQEQLIQQEKLASLGQLTAGIAHEIKNPLNFVNNFSEVSMEMIGEVKEERAKSQESRDESLVDEILNDIQANLSKIHEHGTRADGIVKSMLMHSRGGSGKMEPTDLNALIKEYVNLAFHGMRAGKNPINVDIQLDLDDSFEKIALIEEDFSRVLLNLCNNAFDAMRETAPARQPRLIVRTRQELKHVLIEIEDNGPGIPDEIKDKILQPFFTTKKGTQGTGLGLSITNDIVKAHGGELKIKTEAGNGSVFRIALPFGLNHVPKDKQ